MAELTFCASSAGALGGLAGNPADVVLVRMISDPAKPLAQQLHYRNAAHGVYRMVADEGFLSLFRGLLPNTVSSRDNQCHHHHLANGPRSVVSS